MTKLERINDSINVLVGSIRQGWLDLTTMPLSKPGGLASEKPLRVMRRSCSNCSRCGTA